MTDSKSQSESTEGRIDRLGAVASTACALHCAACAFVPAMFAMLGLDILLGHEAEWALTIFAVSIGFAALAMGWKRHKKTAVLVVISIGIIGLLAARMMEGDHHDEHGEGEVHAASVNQGDKGGEGHHKAEHKDEGEHHEDGHLSGELLGIFAGLFLLSGHIMNLREMRRANQTGQTDCADVC